MSLTCRLTTERARMVLAVVIVALGAAACAPAPSTPQQGQPGPRREAAEPSRTLVAAVRVEPTSLAPAIFREPGVTFQATPRFFNAGVALLDDKGLPRPYLAEAVPELNTQSWQVFPDGRMQTTHRLKPNLTWHDGTGLAAEDFVFAWKVFTTPELGAATSPPHGSMETVTAPDARTVLIHWRRPYHEAATLMVRDRDFVPLPRHLLEQAYRQDHSDAFLALPFWSREYVGLGPYRVDRWEPGAGIDAVAFPGHALGRAKIERVRLVFMSDPNTAMANLLAGSVLIALEASLRFQQGSTLQREWASSQAGVVLLRPWLWRTIQIQLRPELSSPPVLRDVRVRRALFHGVDRQALNDGVLEGYGAITESMISPLADYYATIDRATVKYPLDPRRSEQLMAEVGYSKGADGFFASSTERFATELRVLAGAQNEQELSIIGAGLRQVGFEVRESVLPAAQVQDAQVQSTFAGLFGTGHQSGEAALLTYTSAGISRPENRWIGANRGAWSSPEYDRMAEALQTTLGRNERIQLVAQMARLLSEEVPFISMYFSLDVVAHTVDLRGPQIVAPDTSTNWNIHEWELR